VPSLRAPRFPLPLHPLRAGEAAFSLRVARRILLPPPSCLMLLLLLLLLLLVLLLAKFVNAYNLVLARFPVTKPIDSRGPFVGGI